MRKRSELMRSRERSEYFEMGILSKERAVGGVLSSKNPLRTMPSRSFDPLGSKFGEIPGGVPSSKYDLVKKETDE